MSALSRESDEESSSDLFEINHEYDYEGSLFSFDFQKWNDSVFVAVGNTESRSSMDALEWTLRYLVTPCTVLHLIHVFPLIRHIPSPLGMLTRGQVKPEMVESYVSQERDKRRKLLQKFLDTCSASKVNVDLLLVESDHTVKAILDLIPVLSIRKLVLGTTKLSLSSHAVFQKLKGNQSLRGEVGLLIRSSIMHRMTVRLTSSMKGGKSLTG
ncbi:uncharacterized protein LOC133867735 isoform X2 [Alnus glutinosa]|uniref:uncharacterized protein LOC133867735 isoform X2 n=1 Tax=Alnus glutinosa TaxID=3517 RepID=UPI002D7759D9|nr:uncharacterized protein LOC133867735 isoform X2 [Alnus glutinosa]